MAKSKPALSAPGGEEEKQEILPQRLSLSMELRLEVYKLLQKFGCDVTILTSEKAETVYGVLGDKFEVTIAPGEFAGVIKFGYRIQVPRFAFDDCLLESLENTIDIIARLTAADYEDEEHFMQDAAGQHLKDDCLMKFISMAKYVDLSNKDLVLTELQLIMETLGIQKSKRRIVSGH